MRAGKKGVDTTFLMFHSEYLDEGRSFADRMQPPFEVQACSAGWPQLDPRCGLHRPGGMGRVPPGRSLSCARRISPYRVIRRRRHFLFVPL